MEKIKTDLHYLWARSMDLTEQIEGTLIKFVKKAGGEIKTEENDKCDTIYGIFYNEGTEAYEEHKVLAVKVENNQLFIYAEVYPGDEDNWFAMDMIWKNATLHNLCECLPQYV